MSCDTSWTIARGGLPSHGDDERQPTPPRRETTKTVTLRSSRVSRSSSKAFEAFVFHCDARTYATIMNIGFFGATARFLRGMQNCMDVTTKLFLYNTFTKMLSGPYYPAGEALSDASCFGDRFPAVVPIRRGAPE